MATSNPQFHRVRSAHEYETFTFPKEILYDSSLSGNALKLLLIMLDYGKRPNWELRQTHLLAISEFKYSKFSSAMKNLERSGYVQRSRNRVDGKLTSYIYQFSAFPIFKDNEPENPIHNECEPVEVFKTRNSKLENPNYTYSNIANVLEESTNPDEAKPTEPEAGKSEKKDLVSSYTQKLNCLESIDRISESQKRTLYKKYTHDQISRAILAINIDKADSVFALIISAIKEQWDPRNDSDKSIQDAINLVSQADNFIARVGTLPISVGIDKDNAYIYLGSSTTKFKLNDPCFREKFVESIKKYVKT